MKKPVTISHFSDALCVWAYVSQIRVDELRASFGEEVAVDYHFVPVFGHAREKLGSSWAERGGLAAYGEHVREVVDGFDHVTVHPEVWSGLAPRSSIPAHLVLSAVKTLDPADCGGDVVAAFERTAWAIRVAFFRDLVDVSRQSELLAIAEKVGLPVAQIESALGDGAAHALLSQDIMLARDRGVRASPTLLFNEGRQMLAGNVGYRIIEANVRELLRGPSDRCSWC
jgi:predicted DsbA family dithiol-disulfide isomerase